MLVRRRPALFSFLAPCRVRALPVSYTSAVTTKTCVPLIAIFLSLFFLILAFLVIKLVYMKYRRMGTIHAPPRTVRSIPAGGNLSPGTPSFASQDKRTSLDRGLLVGCLGSPAWETNLTSMLDGAIRRRERRRGSSFTYQLHTGSTHSGTRSEAKTYSSRSHLTKSTALTSRSGNADQPALPWQSSPSQFPCHHDGSSSKAALCTVQRSTSTDCRRRYGDFGESHGVRLPGGDVAKVARRASPSSIRLVDGPSHSGQVGYSFLSVLPPNAIVVSPFVGTRDSFQLSRCSLKCNRKPVPPMPPLPSSPPFHLPSGADTLESHPVRASEYLPRLCFSPLATVANAPDSPRQAVEKKAWCRRVPHADRDQTGVGLGVSGLGCISSASSKALDTNKRFFHHPRHPSCPMPKYEAKST